jgi:hypothetical protein
LFKSLLFINNFPDSRAADAKLDCNLWASLADTPVFLAIAAILSLAWSTPFINIRKADWVASVSFWVLFKSPFNTLVNFPLLSSLLANPVAESNARSRRPKFLEDSLLSFTVASRDFCWSSSCSSKSVISSSLNLFPLAIAIFFLASNNILFSASWFWSFWSSDCFNNPFSALDCALIRFSVFFTVSFKSLGFIF